MSAGYSRAPEAYVLHGSDAWLAVEDAVNVARLEDESLYESAEEFMDAVEDKVHYRYFSDDIYLHPGDDDAVIALAQALEGVTLDHLPERWMCRECKTFAGHKADCTQQDVAPPAL